MTNAIFVHLDQSTIIILTKLLISIFCGGLIGMERETRVRAAGIRTYILVTISSCLAMMVSLNMPDMFGQFNSESIIRLDPGRIGSYVLAGIGFIGGGVIFRHDTCIKGVTTAAGVFLMAVIGLAIGCGLYKESIITTGFSFLILRTLRNYPKSLLRRKTNTIMTLAVEDSGYDPRKIEDILLKNGFINIQLLSMGENHEEKTISLVFKITSRDNVRHWQEAREIFIKENMGIKKINFKLDSLN